MNIRYALYIILIFFSCSSPDNEEKTNNIASKWIENNLKDYDINSISFSNLDSIYFSFEQEKNIKELEESISRLQIKIQEDSSILELNKKYYNIHLNNNIELALLNKRSIITREKNIAPIRRDLEEKKNRHSYIKNNSRFQGFKKDVYILYYDNITDTITFYFNKNIKKISTIDRKDK